MDSWLSLQKQKDEAVQDVIDAWTVAGPHPQYHYRMQEFLRHQWPALGTALDKLAETP